MQVNSQAPNVFRVAQMLAELNEQQREAAMTIDGRVLVIAGAGSGKCITGDSLIYTDKGLLKIKDIPNHYPVDNDDKCETVIISYDTNGKRHIKKTSHWFNMGHSKTIKIITTSGYEIEGTPEHPLLVLNKDGNLVFKKLKDFNGDEYIALSKNNNIWSKTNVVNKNVAYLMGLLVADGRLETQRGYGVYFSNTDKTLIEVYKDILFNEYSVDNIKTYSHENKSTLDHYFSNEYVKKDLVNKGVKPVSARYKEIPWSILQSSKEVVVAFLQALFDTESTMNDNNIEITFASKTLIKQLQVVLLNFGIRSSWSERYIPGYEEPYYRLHISGLSLRVFKQEIGYLYNEEFKRKLEKACLKPSNTNAEIYPYQAQRLKDVRRDHFVGQSFWDGHKQSIDGIGSIKDYLLGKRNPSANKLKQIISYAQSADHNIKFLNNISENLLFEKVEEISQSEAIVYDFTVPETHSFVANGIVNHNTKTLTTRIANMLANGIKPGSIFCATFTNKAAREMKERLANVVGEETTEQVWMGTFHSLCVRILRKHAYLLGFERNDQGRCNFAIYDSYDSLELIKRIYKFMNISERYHVGLAKYYIDDAKNKLWTPEYCLYNNAEGTTNEIMAQVYAHYQRILKESNAMDFGDLIMNTVQLLEEHPDAAEYWQNKFKYISADEFQDTNIAQFELLKNLAKPHYNIFVVGDHDQSIYKFRGSDISIILNFEKHFSPCKIIKLEQNYRSTQTVVNAGNYLIQHNPSPYDKKLRTNKDVGEKIRLVQTTNEYTEAAYVGAMIKELVASGQYKYKDIAILYRAGYQSAPFEQLFVHNFIPFKVVGVNSYFDREEIKDLISYLRVISNRKDDSAMIRILNKPSRGIGNTTIDAIEAYANEHRVSIYRSLKTCEDIPTIKKNIAGKIQTFLSMLDHLESMLEKDIPLSRYVQYVLDYTGLMKLYQDRANKDKNDIERVENLGEFVKLVAHYEQENTEKTLDEFLQEMSLVSDYQEETKTEENAVRMLTMHASKGLEFPVVFIVGFNEQIFPSWRSQTLEDIQEERRLAYVAITRAEERLFITYATERSRMNGKGVQVYFPSRFVNELPKDLLEFQEISL